MEASTAKTHVPALYVDLHTHWNFAERDSSSLCSWVMLLVITAMTCSGDLPFEPPARDWVWLPWTLASNLPIIKADLDSLTHFGCSLYVSKCYTIINV